MDFAAQLAALQELALGLNTEIDQILEKLTSIREEMQSHLAGRVAQLSAENRASNAEEVRAQAVALRVEVREICERHMAAVLSKRQEIIGQTELAAELKSIARDVARQIAEETFRQFAASQGSEISNLNSQIRELAARPLQSTPGDPSAPLSPAPISIVDLFRGQWTPKLALKKGDLFTFRGSVLMAVRDVPPGVAPTKRTQTGPSAYHALFVPAGAPGMKGLDAQAIQLTTFPASAGATGATGQLAYSNGFAALCVAANTWKFWPVSDDYPF